MPTGSLPESGKKLWEKVYEASKKSGDSEEIAAKKAWSAVKSAGWSKDESGNWHKSSEFVEFSMTIKKASVDPKSGEMRWKADASDIDDDSHSDNMSLELYSDFLERIERGDQVPDIFRSEFWSGGMPYLSISHYSDQDGNAVPGPVDAVYVDGKFLKSKGRFYNTPIGKACFNALCEDLKNETEKPKVRVSIGFLDWMHEHKSNGYIFERQDLDDFCPECFKELFETDRKGKIYLKGQLVHLALTRVPVNKRTLMEVDKSMTTQQEDAASIAGAELAEELEIKEKELVGKSDFLVTRAEDECSECGSKMVDGKCPKCNKEEKKSEVIDVPVVVPEVDHFKELSDKLDAILAAIPTQKSEVVPISVHALDALFGQFKSDYDSVILSESPYDEKLRSLQESFNQMAQGIAETIKAKSASVATPSSSGEIQQLTGLVTELARQVGLISAQLSNADNKPKSVLEPPRPRQISPELLRQQSLVEPKSALRKLVERTT